MMVDCMCFILTKHTAKTIHSTNFEFFDLKRGISAVRAIWRPSRRDDIPAAPSRAASTVF